MNAIRPILLSAATFAIANAQAPMQGMDGGTGPFLPNIVVTGSVQFSAPAEGVPLPSDLRIFVDCHGNFTDGGQVSQGGRFRFVLTPGVLAIQAASICTVEAKAFGYDSTIGHIPVQSSSGLFTLDPLTIQRSDRGAVPQERTAKTVSATSLKAPANAVKLFDHGAQSLQKRKFTDAAKDFESAIKLYPDYAEAWLNLGRARVSLDSLVPAREAFRRAAELDPQMAGPPAELGLLAARQGDVASAARYLDESLRLDPAGSFQTCYSDALVNFVLKRYEVAESSARAALRFGETPAQARADYILGMALLALGSNDEARQRLVRYLELAPKAPERDQVMKELSRLDQIGAGAR
jgi:tetratricopeptide (TPR) repeat protein